MSKYIIGDSVQLDSPIIMKGCEDWFNKELKVVEVIPCPHLRDYHKYRLRRVDRPDLDPMLQTEDNITDFNPIFRTITELQDL